MVHEPSQDSLMRSFLCYIAKCLAFLITVSLFVGPTYWVCDRMVGSADPIMHPFLILGPIALLIGGGTGAFAVLVVNAYEQRLNRIESRAKSRGPSDPQQPFNLQRNSNPPKCQPDDSRRAEDD